MRPDPDQHEPQPTAPERARSQDVTQRASHLAELGAMAPLYAHEISNLLTHLSARAQLAIMRPGDAELREEALVAVGDCCRRIEQLTQIFLMPNAPDDSSNSAERLPIKEIHRRVCQSVRRDDLDRFGPHLDDRTDGCAPDLMPVVLEQILSNLIVNALRAIDEHPTPDDPHHRIHIEAHAFRGDVCSMWNTSTPTDAPVLGMEIIVEDTGAGMSPRQVTQLNSGQAVDMPVGPNRSRIARHGLGLRVCRKLLSTAGGRIQCDSSINQGTRIVLRVPAIELHSDQARSAA